MHIILKGLYIIPLMAILVCISNGAAQPSPAEVEKDIFTLLYGDFFAPYFGETLEKVKSNPLPYTDYIETQLILPQTDSELLNDSLTSRYNGLLLTLSKINTPEAAQILENAYYETKAKYLEIKVEYEGRIPAGPNNEEFKYILDLYNNIYGLHTDVISCLGVMKNDLILEDCIDRYPNERLSMRGDIIYYLTEVGYQNPDVIAFFQQICLDPKDDYNQYIQKLISEIDGEIPEEGLSVKLLDSQNNLLIGGQLKYYEGGWKNAIDNGDGTFRVETDRSTVSLRMIYAYASQDMADVPVSGRPAVFQTVSCEVQLKSSAGQLMDEGTVKYYAGGWRDFGMTSGGTAVRELLPKTYTFRAAHSGSHTDMEQDVSANPVVVIVIE